MGCLIKARVWEAAVFIEERSGKTLTQEACLSSLVPQMPEEQAFSVLVKIMFDYGLRELFKQNFEDLHCKFYQLERLMQVRATRRGPTGEGQHMKKVQI